MLSHDVYNRASRTTKKLLGSIDYRCPLRIGTYGKYLPVLTSTCLPPPRKISMSVKPSVIGKNHLAVAPALFIT